MDSPGSGSGRRKGSDVSRHNSDRSGNDDALDQHWPKRARRHPHVTRTQNTANNHISSKQKRSTDKQDQCSSDGSQKFHSNNKPQSSQVCHNISPEVADTSIKSVSEGAHGKSVKLTTFKDKRKGGRAPQRLPRNPVHTTSQERSPEFGKDTSLLECNKVDSQDFPSPLEQSNSEQINDIKDTREDIIPSDKKVFLAAGLYSYSFKIASPPPLRTFQARLRRKDTKPFRGLLLPIYNGLNLLNKSQPFSLPSSFIQASQEGRFNLSAAPCAPFRKIRANVYTDKNALHILNRSKQPAAICDCNPPEDGSPGCTHNCINRLMFFECGNDCPCGTLCTNKRFQRRQWLPWIRRVPTPGKGYGIIATAPVAKDSFIIEYIGEVLTSDTFAERVELEYSEREHFHCLNLDSGVVIDSGKAGSEARFINHSCDPNCHIEKWNVNGNWRAGVFASRDIAANEELTYDYNFQSFKTNMVCRCGAPTCRGEIRGRTPNDTGRSATSTNRISKKRPNFQNTDGSLFNDFLWHRAKKRSMADEFNSFKLRELKVIRNSHIFLARNVAKLKQLQEAKEYLTCAKSEENDRKADFILAFQMRFKALSVAATSGMVKSVQTRTAGNIPPEWRLEERVHAAIIMDNFLSEIISYTDRRNRRIGHMFLKVPPQRRYSQYYKVVTNPISLSTLQERLRSGFYGSPALFFADLMGIWKDAQRGFPKKSEHHEFARLLEQYCERQWMKEVYPSIKEIVGNNTEHFRRTVARMTPTDEVVLCICNVHTEDSETIQCHQCKTWQHMYCLRLEPSKLPDIHVCPRCAGTTVDRNIELETELDKLNALKKSSTDASAITEQPDISRLSILISELEAEANVIVDKLTKTKETLVKKRKLKARLIKEIQSLKLHMHRPSDRYNGLLEPSFVFMQNPSLIDQQDTEPTQRTNGENISFSSSYSSSISTLQANGGTCISEVIGVDNVSSVQKLHNQNQQNSHSSNDMNGKINLTGALSPSNGIQNSTMQLVVNCVSGDIHDCANDGEASCKIVSKYDNLRRELDNIETIVSQLVQERGQFEYELKRTHARIQRESTNLNELRIKIRDAASICYQSLVTPDGTHLYRGKYVLVDSVALGDSEKLPGIVQIHAISQSFFSGSITCTGVRFLRPLDTFSKQKQRFFCNEVFMTPEFVEFSPSSIKGTCYVMRPRDYCHEKDEIVRNLNRQDFLQCKKTPTFSKQKKRLRGDAYIQDLLECEGPWDVPVEAVKTQDVKTFARIRLSLREILPRLLENAQRKYAECVTRRLSIIDVEDASYLLSDVRQRRRQNRP